MKTSQSLLALILVAGWVWIGCAGNGGDPLGPERLGEGSIDSESGAPGPERLAVFAPRADYPLGGQPVGIFGADLDKDGDLDLVAALFERDIVTVLTNSNKTFRSRTELLTGGTPLSVFSADFDGNGDMDLAVANQAKPNVSVFLNGLGRLEPKVDYASAASSQDVCGADLDGDGDLDLATANCSGTSVSVLLNNGDGTFEPQGKYATARCPVSVFAADLDGDGDQDLAVGNEDEGGLKVCFATSKRGISPIPSATSATICHACASFCSAAAAF